MLGGAGGSFVNRRVGSERPARNVFTMCSRRRLIGNLVERLAPPPVGSLRGQFQKLPVRSVLEMLAGNSLAYASG